MPLKLDVGIIYVLKTLSCVKSFLGTKMDIQNCSGLQLLISLSKKEFTFTHELRKVMSDKLFTRLQS